MKPIGGKSYLVPTNISPFCFTLSSRDSAARASEAAEATTSANRASASLRMGPSSGCGRADYTMSPQGRRARMARTVTSPKLTDAYTDALPASHALYERARHLFPDAVTHDNRRMQPFPLYVDRAEGAFKWDVDGRRYIDYLLGHAAPRGGGLQAAPRAPPLHRLLDGSRGAAARPQPAGGARRGARASGERHA